MKKIITFLLVMVICLAPAKIADAETILYRADEYETAQPDEVDVMTMVVTDFRDIRVEVTFDKLENIKVSERYYIDKLIGWAETVKSEILDSYSDNTARSTDTMYMFIKYNDKTVYCVRATKAETYNEFQELIEGYYDSIDNN